MLWGREKAYKCNMEAWATARARVACPIAPNADRGQRQPNVLLRPKADISRRPAFDPIVLKKSFSGDDQNSLEPLIRLACGDVRGHIQSYKAITDTRIGATVQCSGRDGKGSAFVRFSAAFGFQLLQDYLPITVMFVAPEPPRGISRTANRRRPSCLADAGTELASSDSNVA